MPETPFMGADIDIVEPFTTERGGKDVGSLPIIKPSRVRINGADVGAIAKDGISIDPGDGTARALTVTLTLLPKSVSIHAE